MNRSEILRMVLTAAAGLVLLSALLLLATIPGEIMNHDPGADIKTIVIVISVMAILHLVFIAGYLRNLKLIKQGRPVDRGLNVGLGILLLTVCLFLLDGVFASFDNNRNVSVLFLTAASIDFVTALASIGTIFLKPKT